MIKTYTQDDILRYVYDETTKDENSEIKGALLNDEKLRRFYLYSVKLKRQMENIELSPSEAVINKIMEYSRLTGLHPVV